MVALYCCQAKEGHSTLSVSAEDQVQLLGTSVGFAFCKGVTKVSLDITC